jgi:hypothetical protein
MGLAGYFSVHFGLLWEKLYNTVTIYFTVCIPVITLKHL